MNIVSLMVIALIGEALWETLKLIWDDGKLDIDRIGALVVGISLALGTGLDMMEILGVPIRIPYAGKLLTGLLISRGANFMHDILSSINNLQISMKTANGVMKEKEIPSNKK